MATLSEIKNHIHAIEQTRQITNAMYLLSASRMRKTIQRVDYNVRYMRRLRATMKDVIVHSKDEVHHLYLDGREKPETALFIVISGDKGLCGSYNNNILSFADEKIRSYGNNKKLALMGLTGEEYFVSRGIKADFIWRGVVQNPSLYNARVICETILNEYNDGNADEVYVIFTSYKTSLAQNAECMRLLPLSASVLSDVEVEYEYNFDMEFFPSPSEVIGKVIPQYIIAMLFNTFIQSLASEHASRMNSMQTATANADEMLKKLQSDYNAQRQLLITSEITEISATTQTLGEKSI